MTHPVRWPRVAVLLAALVLCVWIGWRDADPWIAQDAVRDGIRLAIRRSLQLAVQFILPALLLGLLLREGVDRRPARRSR